MRFFFSSKQFKIILAVTLTLIAVSVFCIILGGSMSPQSNIFASIIAPFESGINKVSDVLSDFSNAYSNGEQAMIENADLEAEIAELRNKLVDYEEMKKENEHYKQFLEIKENNPDFKFQDATKISSDVQDPYKSFVINKGTADGLKQYDPVITKDGLVGYISEVGISTSKVRTVLSPDITLGALSNRTNDSGVVSGNLELAKNGNTKFYNLSRSCNIAVGDYVVTSGEGIFPKGLLIGEIKSVGSDEYNTSIYAEVKVFANIEQIRDVMVIVGFSGQGGLTVGDGD